MVKGVSTVMVAVMVAAMVGVLSLSGIAFAKEKGAALESFTQIVNSMSEKKTFQADVVQVNTVAGVGNETFSGKVYIQYGERAFWGYTKPSVQTYLIEKEDVIYYDELLEQVYITSRATLQGDLLLELMSNVNSLVNDFNVSNLNGVEGGFALVPKKQSNAIKNVEIYTSNGVIQSLKSYDRRGNIIEVRFSKVNLGGRIGNDKFEIKYPKDVQVIRR